MNGSNINPNDGATVRLMWIVTLGVIFEICGSNQNDDKAARLKLHQITKKRPGQLTSRLICCSAFLGEDDAAAVVVIVVDG